MFAGASVWGIFLIVQLCVGVMGNSLLSLLYLYTLLVQPHLKKPIDAILMHLTLVNILNLPLTLMPNIMASFGVQHFLDDVGCKAIMFLFRVTRGLSICTTSLLSVFQAITISSVQAQWVWLKSKSSLWIFPSFFFFWILNVAIYFRVIAQLKATSNFTLIGSGFSNAYCHSQHIETSISWHYICVLLARDLVFVILMVSTSLHMVKLLYQHHQRTQHLHSPSLASQPAPENKATHTILLLVSCFVFFYCSNNILSFYYFYIAVKIQTLEVIVCILSAGYPTVCPFLLLKKNKILSKSTFSLSLMRITSCRKAFNG
ncbi:vomeronasal type-1 receptor 4-like isoform 1-T2 [Thomomys bottae]